MRINIVTTKDKFDFYIRWMSDSWPQFSTDRHTESNVGPEFFGDLFLYSNWLIGQREIIK